MKSNSMAMLLIAVVVLLGGFYLVTRSQRTSTSPSPTTTTQATPNSSSQPVMVALQTQNGSGQSGTATFTQNADGKVVVRLALTGGSFTTPQPAHIHVGSCPNPGAVKYPLTNVVNGMSETVLPVSWAELEASPDKLAVNVHKSANEAKMYTACGDIAVKSGGAVQKTPSAGSVSY